MTPKDRGWKFVADQRTPVYKTLASELAAIARGTKRLSFFATDRAGLAADLAEIEPLAGKRGLVTTVATRKGAIDIFVHRAESARWIPSLQALLSSSPWSFDHEAALGKLLGYSAADRKAWLAAERHARPAFGVLTLYGESRTKHVPPCLWWSAPGRVVAADAYATRARGAELWRVGVTPSYARRLDPSGTVLLRHRRGFERAMRTPYEVLRSTGWREAIL